MSGVSSVSSPKEWNTRIVAIGMISSKMFLTQASEGIWVYYGYFGMMHDVFFGAKIHIFYKKTDS